MIQLGNVQKKQLLKACEEKGLKAKVELG